VAGDAGDEGAEDERRDNDADEAEEDVAKDAAGQSDMGSVDAELDACQHADEDPAGEGAAARGGPGEKDKRDDADSDGCDARSRPGMLRCGCGGVEHEAGDRQHRDIRLLRGRLHGSRVQGTGRRVQRKAAGE
jgi:hypothetical protein